MGQDLLFGGASICVFLTALLDLFRGLLLAQRLLGMLNRFRGLVGSLSRFQFGDRCIHFGQICVELCAGNKA